MQHDSLQLDAPPHDAAQPSAPLRQVAWILSDGHAGNVRQARALATAMGLTETREWALQPRAPWRWFAPRRAPGAAHAFGATYRQVSTNPPAVAIGCGRQAALATRLLRERGARTVQILDPRMDTRHWDLVIAPAHDELHGSNVVNLQGSLHPVDDLWLAAGRQQFAVFTSLPRPRTALLVGGTSAHGGLHVAALGAYLDRLAERVAAEAGSVLATASRRTPATAAALLRAKLSPLSHDVWCDDRDGTNPYAGLLGWADRIVCTADSVNMLSEAAATNVPVFALGIDALQGRPRRFVDGLVAMGRIRAFDGELAPFPVVPLRETARVAAEVRQRLGL